MPLLILHGELDKRVPTTQSYELYKALIAQNKPVKMMILPQEAHLPIDVNVIFDNINQIDAWLKKAL